MSIRDVLRSVKAKDLLELELAELERLCVECQSAFAQKSNEESAIAQLGGLKLQPEAAATSDSDTIKLNVGGQYFATSRSTLTSEKNTFFSIQFGGKWDPKIDAKDGALFIDRSPAVFGVILDYLRARTIDLKNLSGAQLKALKAEADYYQISSLLALFPTTTFSPHVRGWVKLTMLDSVAINEQAGNFSYVVSDTPFFSPSQGGGAAAAEKSVKLVAGNRMFIGVAPHAIVENERIKWKECGWFVSCSTGKLFGIGVNERNQHVGAPIASGSTVTVKIDQAFHLYFLVDGKRWCTLNYATYSSSLQPLHLCVVFGYATPNLVLPGTVQLTE